MIQRIQSIFLFLAVAALISTSFFPLWEKVNMETREKVTLTTKAITHVRLTEASATEVVAEQNTIYIMIVALMAAGVALYSIFQYKNRLRQIQLGALNSLLMSITLGLALWQSFQAEQAFTAPDGGGFLAGFWVIIAALIFNMLANRFIRKDEKLVKSMDRIR